MTFAYVTEKYEWKNKDRKEMFSTIQVKMSIFLNG